MRNKTIFSKYFVLLMINYTLLFINYTIINPILPKYAISLGMSISLAGIISGAFALTALVFRPVSGKLADKKNPKMLFIISNVIMAAACVMYVLGNSFASLLIARIAHGVAFALISVVSIVILLQFVPKNRIGQAIGLYGMGSIIAISFGPAIGLELGNAFGYHICFLLAGSLPLISIVVLLFIPYEYKRNEADTREKNLRNDEERLHGIGNVEGEAIAYEKTEKEGANQYKGIKKIIATEVLFYAILAGFFSFANGVEFTFIALYAQSKSIENISLYFTVSAIFILVSRLFAGKIYDTRGLAHVLIPAFIVASIGMNTLSFANYLWVFFIAAALKGLGQGAGQPSLQAQCINSVPAYRVGLASSTYFIGPDVMQGLGPIVGGYIIAYSNYETIFFVCGGLLALGLIIYAIHLKNNKYTASSGNV